MDDIINNIKDWIINFIEIKTPIFGNLPVCPFARKERIKNKINYIVTDISNIDNIISNIEQNNFDDKTTLLLIDTHNKLTVQEKEKFEDIINEKCPNNWAVYCLANEDLNFNGFKTRTNEYPLIIITGRKEVEKAEASLENTDYFQYWTEYHKTRLKVD
jgi:hypothetical protein